jgi:hypothetical protein
MDDHERWVRTSKANVAYLPAASLFSDPRDHFTAPPPFFTNSAVSQAATDKRTDMIIYFHIVTVRNKITINAIKHEHHHGRYSVKFTESLTD